MPEPINVRFSADQAVSKARELTGAMGNLGGTTNSVINSVRRAAGVFIAFRGATFIRDQFVNATKAAVEFEDQMAQVQKVTSRFEADQLTRSIQTMATEIPIARDEITSIVEQAGRLGIEGTANIENFTETISKLAVATNLSAEESAKSFSRIIAVTDASINEIENLGSVVNELSNTMATSADEIVEGMLRSSAAASRFGLRAEDISAISASINEVSATARRANTRVRRLFQELNRAENIPPLSQALGQDFSDLVGESPIEAVRELVLAFRRGGEAADIMTETFSTSTLQALAGLSQNVNGLDKALGNATTQMKENTSLQREFEIQAGTTASRTQLLSNRVTNLQTEVGNALLPSLNASISAFGRWAESINEGIFGVTKLREEMAPMIGEGTFSQLQNQLTKASDGASMFSTQTDAIIKSVAGLALVSGTFATFGTLPAILAGGAVAFGVFNDAVNEGKLEAEAADERLKKFTKTFSNMNEQIQDARFQQEFSENMSQFTKNLEEGAISAESRLGRIISATDAFEKAQERVAKRRRNTADIVFGNLPDVSFEDAVSELDLTDFDPRVLQGLGTVMAQQAEKEFGLAIAQTDIRDDIVQSMQNKLRTALEDIRGVTGGTITDISKDLESSLGNALKEVSPQEIKKVSALERETIFKDILQEKSEEELRNIDTQSLSQEYVKRIRVALETAGRTISGLIADGELLQDLQNLDMETVSSRLADQFGEETQEQLAGRIKALGLGDLFEDGVDLDQIEKLSTRQRKALEALIPVITETKKELQETKNTFQELINIGQIQLEIQSLSFEDIQKTLSENVAGNELKKKIQKRIEENNIKEIIEKGIVPTGEGAQEQIEIIEQLLSLRDVRDEADKTAKSLESMVTISQSEFLPESALNRSKIKQLKEFRRELEEFDDLQPGEIQLIESNIDTEIKQLRGQFLSFGELVDQTMTNVEDRFSDALTDMVIEGEFSFRKLGRIFVEEFTRQVVQNNIVGPLLRGGESGNGLLGSLLSSIPIIGGLFYDTPGVIEAGSEGALLGFAPGDQIAASQSRSGLQDQVGGQPQGNVTVEQTNNFPVTPDSKIDRRIQRAAPQIVSQAKNATLEAIRRGGSDAKTARSA